MKSPVVTTLLLVALTFTAAAAIGGGGSPDQSAAYSVPMVDAAIPDAATTSEIPPVPEDAPLTRSDEPGNLGLLATGVGMVLLALAGRRKWRPL